MEIVKATEKNVEYKAKFADVNNQLIGRGCATFFVNHQKKGERYIVSTIDYHIEVTGTYFKLYPDIGGHVSTSVCEGSVRIVFANGDGHFFPAVASDLSPQSLRGPSGHAPMLCRSRHVGDDRDVSNPSSTAHFMCEAGIQFVSATPSYWRRLLLFADLEVLKRIPLVQISLGGEVVDQRSLMVCASISRRRDLFIFMQRLNWAVASQSATALPGSRCVISTPLLQKERSCRCAATNCSFEV